MKLLLCFCGCSLVVGWGFFCLFLLQLISFSIYFVLTKYKCCAFYCLNDTQETHSLGWQAMRKPLGSSHLEFNQNKSSTLAQTLNILFIQVIHENSIQFQHFCSCLFSLENMSDCLHFSIHILCKVCQNLFWTENIKDRQKTHVEALTPVSCPFLLLSKSATLVLHTCTLLLAISIAPTEINKAFWFDIEYPRLDLLSYNKARPHLQAERSIAFVSHQWPELLHFTCL